MLQLKLLALTLIWWWTWWSTVHHVAVADPQTHLLKTGCSPYNTINLQRFFEDINGTFSNLRTQISNQSKHFATAQEARADILAYAMFQCRNYLSKNDCLACFNTATTQIRNCSAANGARVIYDGCFLRGYTAPEYAIHGQLSEKADTYSYGIVVLEIISGQKSTQVKTDDEGHEYLLQRTWKLYERGMHLELVDKALDPNDFDAEEVKKIIEIALLCTQASAATRPTMSEVVVLLKSKSLLEHLQPTMPVFVDSNLKAREDKSTSNASSTSNATVSTTILSAR